MKERERARWRCRRGLLELDVVLQRFMDKHYAALDEAGIRQFEMLLDFPDTDLWHMIVQKDEDEGKAGLQPVLRLLQSV
ncbi:antitoxin CptB [Nitrosospira multiformis]|uniref:FAD assembly factor SdhE n=1 Tax=Nitrosospira multiformis TaxID=1231 RepID=A0A1I0DKD8_9PROT|nr:succinate dehydrogenase assembly factor 2 [Nitrosospira multiformis]SET32621.1 antitoxin CptB [Nitrosospira multiformis]